jgi:septal ring factor EnvC (AmiA/AmiB activator)
VNLRPLILVGLAIGLAPGWLTLNADESLTKADAEARLNQLEKEIGNLKEAIERNRSSLSEEQHDLKNADLEIQAIALQLRQLESTRQEHDRKLSSLQAERENYLHGLDDSREMLATQILAAYRLGRESRLKLVLNQDSPALLSRTLAYYDYFSRSQSTQIHQLRQVLETLDKMQSRINTELSALADVQKNQQNVLDDLKDQRGARQEIIDRLSSQVSSDELRLTELQNNRNDLEALLEQLSNVLADIPADLGQRLGPVDLKGKMPMPVKGRVKHAFGQPRTAGLRWHGWLIGAEVGSEVKAVAYGRVAYADWLRGYGLLMIIDHGDGMMTLYANNESLTRDIGDWIEPGTVISTVGSSSISENGLYFEIRRNSKALDPAVWLKR